MFTEANPEAQNSADLTVSAEGSEGEDRMSREAAVTIFYAL